ncbi:MAG: thermonuclease family protein [Alphaproteobacteria bacterium]|nr:thermonuclease family protein [Alphaproteobacteria bacterium]MBF0251340.1 thermonuclease family protein [Alphaproteobacteria bacterium]
MRALFRVVLLIVAAVPAMAGGPGDLPDGGRARVVEVVDGDTVALDDGRQVRLVGIQAPKLPLGRPGFRPWPLGEEAKAELEALALGRTVELRLAPTPQDRHGRVLAHVLEVDGGAWLQGRMLERGLARVYTFPDNRALGSEMLALERQARADRLGIWGLPHYAIRTPDNVRHDVGGFQLVEGRVIDVARVKKTLYLNFGANWRTDFTIQVDARDEPRFRDAGVDPMTLKGKRVRVRGWVKSKNGPLIELDHPERLEVLDGPG